jgi:hypothetical protein
MPNNSKNNRIIAAQNHLLKALELQLQIRHMHEISLASGLPMNYYHLKQRANATIRRAIKRLENAMK